MFEATAKRSERDRMADVKTISGVFTGAYAEHPFTKKPIISKIKTPSFGVLKSQYSIKIKTNELKHTVIPKLSFSAMNTAINAMTAMIGTKIFGRISLPEPVLDSKGFLLVSNKLMIHLYYKTNIQWQGVGVLIFR